MLENANSSRVTKTIVAGDCRHGIVDCAGQEEALTMIDMLCILIRVMVSWLYASVKTY